ncbi:MAG: TolC family protein [Elusimicrobiota bacterium]
MKALFILLIGFACPAAALGEPARIEPQAVRASSSSAKADVEVSTSASAPRGRRTLGLSEAYRLALRRSEELSQQARSVEEAWARVDELWSAVKPAFSLKVGESYQDRDERGVPPLRRDKPQAQVALHQPLFSGLRDFLAVRVGRDQGRSAELDLRRAQELLYADVAAAYIDELGMMREIEIRRAVVDLTEDRVRELKERERIGRSRKSEALAAESLLAQNQADLKDALRRERDAQLRLRFLTGLDDDLACEDVALHPAGNLEEILESCRTRPDIEARRLDLESARRQTSIVRRGRWPVMSLDGNYYLRRLSPYDSVKWDLSVLGELPLYQGGRVGAQTRQAASRESIVEESLGLSLRKAELEVRAAYEELQAILESVAALEKAAQLAEANSRAQAEDYRLGLVTNLDVLGALTSLQQVRLRLDRARLDARLARIRLDVAAGSI